MMSRKVSVLVVSAILLSLLGCRAPTPQATRTTPTASIQSTQYLTALEAYVEIRPTMQEWHEDAFVCGIYSSRSERSEKRVRADGRAIVWNFKAYSPEAQRLTNIVWVNGEIQVGISDASGGEVPASGQNPLPVEQMIDSSRTVEIALQNGASASDTLYYFNIHSYDGRNKRDISPSWTLAYNHPHDLSKQMVLMIDITTGEVLRNDFDPPPPTPTPVRPPVPNQLTLYTYGDFDLMVTNAQGLSIGIDADSGAQVAQIPAAWMVMDPAAMNEDAVRSTVAILMDPPEGRYRVHLHGPGEREKRCRLVVEFRKGDDTEIRREMEIPCAGGVSLVYEFTLSLAGDEMVSDVTPVSE